MAEASRSGLRDTTGADVSCTLGLRKESMFLKLSASKASVSPHAVAGAVLGKGYGLIQLSHSYILEFPRAGLQAPGLAERTELWLFVTVAGQWSLLNLWSPAIETAKWLTEKR